MCGHTPDLVIYSKFHRNSFRDFGAPGGRNLPIPITLAIGFYNSDGQSNLTERPHRGRTSTVLEEMRLQSLFESVQLHFLKEISVAHAYRKSWQRRS